MGEAIMLQGTASSVGKSFLVAALCRIFAQKGYSVAPFKSQNMGVSLRTDALDLQISEAQYRQALAAGAQPVVEMNPIFLKPIDDLHSEVFVNGESQGIMSAQEYIAYKPKLLAGIGDALATLKAKYDLVIIEGAGSPAEVNLREHDLANMVVADLANAPVFLVADIDLGGVFAYVRGTLKLLLPRERAKIQGIIVNKFRGDPKHFSEGVKILEELAKVPVLGVVPFLAECDAELDYDYIAERVLDSLDLSLIEKSIRLGGNH